MDWIEEIIEKIRKKLLDASLKKSLAVYIAVAAAAVICLSVGTGMLCEGWRKLINMRYAPMDTAYEWEREAEEDMYRILVSGEYYSVMSGTDKIIYSVFWYIENWCVLFYSIGAIILVSWMFYRNKLEEPITIIQDGAMHVSRGELDFDCTYTALDEMGELCGAFDAMRRRLIDNYQTTWNLMEEQRCLNAAFAHDLRTPLTVIRGYTEFLRTYYPTGKVSEESLTEYLTLIDDQVIRLRDFSNTMKKINTMEELEPKLKKQDILALVKKLQETVLILDGMEGISFTFEHAVKEGKEVYADEAMIMEVAENLISNAMRYAKEHIELYADISEDGDYLQVYVQDDGPGFTREGLEKASKPYFGEKGKGGHFGIGLFICKVLCEKHRGRLDLSNSIEGGAICCASFYIS